MYANLRRALFLLLCLSMTAEAQVTLGVDVLLETDSPHARLIEGKRIGLITNPSGVDGRLIPTADRLARDKRTQLVRLYGPEHGIRGDVAAGKVVGDEKDPVTGIPVTSLYGSTKRPPAETLTELDAVVFDIQDIGSRTYTYISTLGEALIACAAAGKPLIVLDRPNPIGGTRFEGPLLTEAWKSFIGWGPMPVTHGMTAGEAARFFNAELKLGCELHVVPMRGWKREMVWEDTGLAWTQTSPHVPNAIQAHLYVTTGMIASSTKNISEGVGSTMPFELIGAEFVDANRLETELNALRLPGVRFQALAWKPFYGKQQDKPMRGVRLRVDDPRAYQPLRTAIALLVMLEKQYPGKIEYAGEQVLGKHWSRTDLEAKLKSGASADQIIAEWNNGLDGFAKARARALIY